LAIAVDSMTPPNAFVTGYTDSTNFPSSMGAYQPMRAGLSDAFVTRFSDTGVQGFSTYLGGSGDDRGVGIAVDSVGSFYVTGYTQSSNFPVTVGAYQIALKGGADVFVTKVASTGSTLVYSTYLGGSLDDQGAAIAVDLAGRAYVTGHTASTDFPVNGLASQ